MLLSQATGSIWLVFDIIGSEACKVAGNNIVTFGNEEVACGHTAFLSAKLFHQTSVLPYSTDNRSTANTDLTLRDHSLHILKLVLICYVKGHL